MQVAPVRLVLVASLVLFALDGFSSASAQPTSGSDAEARGLFDAATAAFEEGRFEVALGYFQRAHELSGRPELLFNVASTYERLREDRAAIEAYEAYLAALPQAQNRAFVDGRLRILRPIVEAEDAEAARDREREATVPTPREVAEDAQPTPVRDDDRGGLTDDVRPHRTRRIVLISVAAAVVAGAAIGLAVGLGGHDTRPLVPGDIGPGGIVNALRHP